MNKIINRINFSLLFLAINAFVLIDRTNAEDIGVVNIVTPSGTAEMFVPQTVQIVVRNYASSSISSGSFTVSYQVDSQPVVTERISAGTIAPGGDKILTFDTKADLSVPGTHSITATTILPADSNTSNDSFTSPNIISSPLTSSTTEISSFPYLEDFEGSSASDWTPYAYFPSSTIFELGTPTKGYINAASSGTKAWVTGLSANYSSNTRTQVISPIFDLRDVAFAEISLDTAWESNPNVAGAKLETSTDGGTTWQSVGVAGEPDNWYNNGNVSGLTLAGGNNDGWSGYLTSGSSSTAYTSSGSMSSISALGYISSGSLGSGGYVTSKHTIPGGEKTKVRLIFASNGGSDEGFAFDNFAINSGGTVTQTAAFFSEYNSNSIANPGEFITFTAVIANTSQSDLTNVSYSDLINDNNLVLKIGSVTTTHGTITTGNTSGDNKVEVNVGTVPVGESATITFQVIVTDLLSSVVEVCSQGYVSSDQFSANTNDPATVTSQDTTCLAAADLNGELAYSEQNFEEAPANDGSIQTVSTATLQFEEFRVTSGLLTNGVDYTAINVPAGLTLEIQTNSSTTATVTLTGNASSHEAVDSVSNMGITFLNNAFVIRPASKVTNSEKLDFAVNFANAPTATPTATLTPVSTSTPQPTATTSPTNTPSITPTPVSTVGAGEIQGQIVDTNGNPLPGIVVYLTITDESGNKKLLTVLTDSKGNYNFKDLPAGSYVVEPDYDGLSFVPPTLDLNEGNVVKQIVGGKVALNDTQCERVDSGANIVNANDKSLKLLQYSQARVKAILDKIKKQNFKYGEEVRKPVNRLNKALQREYNTLIKVSRELPKLQLNCPATANCTATDYKKILAKYNSQIDELRKLSFMVLDQYSEVFGKYTTQNLTKRVITLHRRAITAAKKLPKKSSVCS